YMMVGDICTANGALEVYVADNATNSRRIWGVRKNIGETYNLWSRPQSNEDLVVPPAAMGRLVTRLNELAAEHGVLVSSYGHAGDGNLHTRIRCPLDWDDARWEAVLPGILDNVYALVAELGGRISGEHGIGHKRKQYMNRVVSEEYINILRGIKRAMDPNNILNPGKIFDL
ncbi:MAG: FAD-binding oxidoreductase, partial [Spirochaeta sp.]|nr:FAD-binding oxidoreductase [Spirochaeta sp.]